MTVRDLIKKLEFASPEGEILYQDSQWNLVAARVVVLDADGDVVLANQRPVLSGTEREL
jgi:hypothetical protein